MYKKKSIAIIIPAYNEELLIERVLTTMPDFVDKMIVINDASTDRTLEIVKKKQANDPRIEIIDHEKNQGVGQSLIDGYVMARNMKMDITAVMAGDAQMSPADLPNLLEPLVAEKADYTKGNRLLRQEVVSRMPKYRLVGNAVLSLLTKFATGYWRVIDPQCGYTAISLRALEKIPIENMIKGYGYNADLLYMLNLNNCKVCDVEVEPIYGEETSYIKLRSYIPKVSALLIKLFFKRTITKFFVREFNPLIFFYFFCFSIFFLVSLPLTIRFFYFYYTHGYAPQTTLIILVNALSVGFLSLFFGMWLDMEHNRKLSPELD